MPRNFTIGDWGPPNCPPTAYGLDKQLQDMSGGGPLLPIRLSLYDYREVGVTAVLCIWFVLL